MSKTAGKVYLIGAGPGDPGLLTLKGRSCIARSDVVIYDYLAAPELLAHAGPDAELIYVGKKGGDHTLPQAGINDLIVEKAGQGRIVARLKGGDPFIFGRGGEEVERLIEEGIDFEVVPGVTSAVAAPAYAGIPLTHRQFTSSVTFVTGHEDPAKETSSINWQALAQGGGTLVFFMGVKNLTFIAERLLHYGMSRQTPAALVRWGTTPRQQTVTGTLGTIADVAADAGMAPPALIVVGEVVRLREKMKWFETRPLFGKSIVVTRARAQASDLVSRLAELGAVCHEVPAIRIIPEEDYGSMDRAISEITAYDWLIFTSVNGVDFFFKRLFYAGLDVRALGRIRTAVIGPATAERLLGFGIKTDILPASFRAESVIDAFKKEPMAGKRVLLPRAKEARPILPVELTRMGAVVDEIPVYRTIRDGEGDDDIVAALAAGKIDMITFTSSSTVTNFKALLPENRFRDLIQNVAIAAIGPITADTARENGFPVHVTADQYTIDGLCDAIMQYYCP
ncbi:MAG: uroporphyrinogen-III C-methyltransferase [Desulfobacteraceae bacterium]|jgi:uroporphyrinogen III methyltransferase/synthase|nr:MAG: uroporphyrinogen-III C-methyltransferase [Desulfobacteraceae bacterium]